jgi:hypothetical protein
MVAATSMRKPVLKQCFEASNAIPVERAMDHAKPGIGTIRILDELTIDGKDTKFLS